MTTSVAFSSFRSPVLFVSVLVNELGRSFGELSDLLLEIMSVFRKLGKFQGNFSHFVEYTQ